MSLKKLLNKLIREGELKRQETDNAYLQSLLDAAKRNFVAASLIEGKIDEAAFKLFYDGLLQIGRVILLLNGYRPDDGEQHKTTFAVAGEFLGNEYTKLIKKIQKYRVKRNNCIYDPYNRFPEARPQFYSSLKDRPEMRWGSLSSSSKKILRCWPDFLD